MQNTTSLSIIIMEKMQSYLTPVKQIVVDLFSSAEKNTQALPLATSSQDLIDWLSAAMLLKCIAIPLSFPGIHLAVDVRQFLQTSASINADELSYFPSTAEHYIKKPRLNA